MVNIPKLFLISNWFDHLIPNLWNDNILSLIRTLKGPQSFVPFSKSPSYPNLPLCGTKRKMSYLTRDFTKSSPSLTDKFFELFSKRWSCLIEPSNAAKGSWDSCIVSSSISEKPAFLKQFLTAFGVNSAHANTTSC